MIEVKLEWHKSPAPIGGYIYDASYAGFQMTVRRVRCGCKNTYMLTVRHTAALLEDEILFNAYFGTLATATLAATAFAAGYDHGQAIVFARLD